MTQADNRIKRDTGIPREILQHLDLAELSYIQLFDSAPTII